MPEKSLQKTISGESINRKFFSFGLVLNDLLVYISGENLWNCDTSTTWITLNVYGVFANNSAPWTVKLHDILYHHSAGVITA